MSSTLIARLLFHEALHGMEINNDIHARIRRNSVCTEYWDKTVVLVVSVHIMVTRVRQVNKAPSFINACRFGIFVETIWYSIRRNRHASDLCIYFNTNVSNRHIEGMYSKVCFIRSRSFTLRQYCTETLSDFNIFPLKNISRHL